MALTFDSFVNRFYTNSTDNFAKVLGLKKDVFKVASEVLKAIPLPGASLAAGAFGVLSAAHGTGKGVIGAYGIVERYKDWANHANSTAIQTAQKVALTIGNALEAILFLAEPFLNAFEVATATIAELPVVQTAMKIAYALNSALAIWVVAGELSANSEKQERTEVHLKKWKAFNPADEGSRDTISKNHLEALQDEQTASKLKTAQIAKYETRLSNCDKTKTKSWISIATDTAKIAVIVLGILAVALIARFSLISAAAVANTLLGIGLTASVLGFAKAMNKEFFFNIQNEPEFGN